MKEVYAIDGQVGEVYTHDDLLESSLLEHAGRRDGIGFALESLYRTSSAGNLSSELNQIEITNPKLSRYVQESLQIYAGKQVSLESGPGVLQKLSDVFWKDVHTSAASIISMVSQYHVSMQKQLAELKKRNDAFRKHLGNLASSSRIKNVYVKPGAWAEKLFYLDSGFENISAKQIAGDACWVLKEHKEKLMHAQQVFGKWLSTVDVEKHAQLDFSKLELRPEDLYAKGSTRYDKSINQRIQRDNDVFWRSRELAGGLALYTETPLGGGRGMAAVVLADKLQYSIDPFEPSAYNRRIIKIRDQRILNRIEWSLSVIASGAMGSLVAGNPIPLLISSVTSTVGLTASIAQHITATQVAKMSDVRHIKLPKDMLLKTLDKKEIGQWLDAVDDTIQELERWSEDLFKKSYWNKDVIFQVVDTMTSHRHDIAYDGGSMKNLRRVCRGFLSIICEYTRGMDTYAMSQAHAMQRYIDACLDEHI